MAMASRVERQGNWARGWLRKAMWVGAASLVVLPALAMAFTPEVNWTGSDFAAAAVVLFGSAGLVDLAAGTSASTAYRAATAVAVAAAAATIWINAAVGMIGPEGNDYNRWFMAVPVLAAAGALLAGLRARGMAVAMVATAIAQVVTSVAGMTTDARGAMLSAGMGGLWLLSAGLFGKAARDGRER
jgi:hypothetical protein